MGCARDMIKRLRPKYTDDELRRIYSTPHQHARWKDHRVRVDTTIALARVLDDVIINSIADLSCGDSVIPVSIRDKYFPGAKLYLGDFAEGYSFTGPIEETIKQIPEVDLYVCSESIEHWDMHPEETLKLISTKANYVIVTTPLEERIDNPEHYWYSDKEGISDCLTSAGFTTIAYQELTFNYLNDYGYQMHVAERK